MNGKQHFEPVTACLNSLLYPLDLPMPPQLANALLMIPLGSSWTFSAFVTFMISSFTLTTPRITVSRLRLS